MIKPHPDPQEKKKHYDISKRYFISQNIQIADALHSEKKHSKFPYKHLIISEKKKRLRELAAKIE